METEVKLLEIGMYIFEHERWGNGLIRYQINRVTPKQASAPGITVKRVIIAEQDYFTKNEKLVVKKVGEYGTCYLQTTELLNQWKVQNTIRKAHRLHNDFKIKNITEDDAKKIIALYESITPTTN